MNKNSAAPASNSADENLATENDDNTTNYSRAENLSKPADKCSPWLLFAMPIAVGLLLSLLVTIINVIQSVDGRAIYLGLDGLRSVIGYCLVGLAVIAFAAYQFRPKLRTLAVAAAICIFCGSSLCQLVRIESFYGNMVPKLVWSWAPTAEEQLEAYFVSRHSEASMEAKREDFFRSTQADFPSFLGSGRDGVIPGIELEPNWDINPPREIWRHPVGLGWSSFAVVGRAAVNLEQRGEDECVVCYDALSGTELWSYREHCRFEDEHGDGPRSTPTITDGKVFSMGATGILTCLELSTGNLLWKRETLADPSNHNLLWGMSGSPLIHDGKIIVTPGGTAASAICYSAEDGSELWRAGEDPGGYASPVVANICGEFQILSFNGAGLRAFSLDGKPQWIVPWLTQGEMQRVNVAQPIILPNSTANSSRVLISSGYGNGTALIEVRRQAGQWQSQTLWNSQRLKSKMSNFVVRENFIYGLDSGILTCIDLASGERRWKQGRYGHGQMLLIGEHLLIQTESGEVVLVAASPNEHRPIGSFQALDGKTWNHLALAGNLLIVRNDHEAAAYDLPILNSMGIQ